jgi:hypothetical protein
MIRFRVSPAPALSYRKPKAGQHRLRTGLLRRKFREQADGQLPYATGA